MLAELEGTISAIAPAASGLFVCSDDGGDARAFRVSTDGSVFEIGAAHGQCRRVVVEDPFVYFAVADADFGGVYRSDVAGHGFHRHVAIAGAAGFAVHEGELTVTTSEHSTPLTARSGWSREMPAFAQNLTQAGPIVALADGRVAWVVPATREVLVTSADGGAGGAVYNGTHAVGTSPIPTFLIAADAGGVVLLDGSDLYQLPTTMSGAPVVLASELQAPIAIALRASDVVVVEVDRIVSYPRSSLAVPAQISTAPGQALATLGERVFVARAGSLVELR